MIMNFDRAWTGWTSSRLPSFLTLLICIGVAACGDPDTRSTAPRTAAPTVADLPLPDVLATIGEEPITLDDVRARVGEQYDRMTNEYLQARYNLLDETLREIMRDRLIVAEAEERGMRSVDELIEAESGSSLDVTDEEVEAWYEENQSRAQGRALDEIRGQIADHLRSTKREEVMSPLEDRLSVEQGVVYHLQPYRVELDNRNAPSLGPSDAAVTLVEFSDFECPYCGRFFPTFQQIKEHYGDRIHVVYRQFPLTNIHPSAFKAAEASLCANEQGEFWAFHDLLFEEQDRIAVRDLKEKAGRLGLDQNEFNNCLDTGRYVEQVQDDLAAGQAAGVNGTPALFVNGIPVEGGAVAFEVVAEVIEEELRRAEM
jgi:protein-disulfide isomerase